MFDTLQYAKRLNEAGFTDEQAKVQAEAIKDLIEDKLATKKDVKAREEHLTNKITSVEDKLTIKLGSLMIVGFTA